MLIFELINHSNHQHHFTITEIENMIPFERDLYVELLSAYIQKKSEAG
jgi:hypothetical protein